MRRQITKHPPSFADFKPDAANWITLASGEYYPDILLGEIFEKYPNPDRAVDFVVFDQPGKEILAIGLARYDSDRGGAQEDDRTGGYHNCADEILGCAKRHHLRTKVIFINDGPGLLLGSMWDDYAKLERSRPGKILVASLRMVPERITREWLLS